MEEAEFRARIQATFDVIERALESADPDVVEVEQSLGSLTLTFSGGKRCILSTQPSVRQLWLAVAHLGIAHHFNWSSSGTGSAAGAAGVWNDDKGKGVELLSFLETQLRDAAGLRVSFR
jgi:CyaY protein